jgi:hypothetical protein
MKKIKLPEPPTGVWGTVGLNDEGVVGILLWKIFLSIT